MASQDHTRSRSSEETALLRSVLRRLPRGVLGGYYAHDDLQFVVKEARRAHLYDFSGREYLDYLLGSGPMVLGHAHPAVIERGLVKVAQKIYVSLAHSEEDIQRTVEVFTAAFEAVAEQRA